jgi:hypothetical protein
MREQAIRLAAAISDAVVPAGMVGAARQTILDLPFAQRLSCGR